MLLKFIWDSKKPRVKMKTLKLAKRRGGVGPPQPAELLLFSPTSGATHMAK